MLTDTTDWSSQPVIYYKLTFSIINTAFIADLEDTDSNEYQLHNKTLCRLVSTAGHSVRN